MNRKSRWKARGLTKEKKGDDALRQQGGGHESRHLPRSVLRLTCRMCWTRKWNAFESRIESVLQEDFFVCRTARRIYWRLILRLVWKDFFADLGGSSLSVEGTEGLAREGFRLKRDLTEWESVWILIREEKRMETGELISFWLYRKRWDVTYFYFRVGIRECFIEKVFTWEDIWKVRFQGVKRFRGRKRFFF